MSTYELDDELVLRFTGPDRSDSDDMALCFTLSAQSPAAERLPIPTRPGAVVKTYAGAMFALLDPHEDLCWREVGGDERWFDNEDLPRISEVLFEGADL